MSADLEQGSARAGADLGDVPSELREPVATALSAAGIDDGHIALEIASEDRIRELNRVHRDRDRPTDVLAFPIDGGGESAGPRELGDVVICPEHCTDVVEAAVHGVLHLCGYDHETDAGEMLALQVRVMDSMPPDRVGQIGPHMGAKSAQRGEGEGR